jgi:hypothetical protein
MEIRAGSVHGTLLAETSFHSKNAEIMIFEERRITLQTQNTSVSQDVLQDLYFVFRNEQNQGQGVIAVDWLKFEF